MGELELFLLGPPEIKVEGAPLAIRSAKARALLFYLADTGRSHPRDHLANLLWSPLPPRNARRNLRVELHRLRGDLDDYLLADPRTLGPDPAADWWVDVAHFRALVRVGEEPPAGIPLPAEHLHQLQEAAGLYRGDFLEEFDAGDAPEFDAWLAVRREQMRRRAIRLREVMATAAEDRGDLHAAIGHVRAILDLMPWREGAHRRLMTLLARAGRRAEALAQFDRCRAILAEELQVDPAPATRDLYRRIQAGTRPAGAELPRRHNLPAPTTSFIGRQAELAQIAGLLADPGCRLLSLIGPGGSGKTRLALEAVRRAVGDFTGGVYFVPLESVAASAQLPATVMSTLGVSPTPRQDPLEQLLAYLQPREMLLVLDNFEHLLAGAELLPRLLEEAPGLRLLVTSRQALKLYEEWLLELEGLPYPQADTPGDPARFDAVALFAQRARRVQLGFDLAAHNAEVADICRLLWGMPLGIELAAAWVRTIAPAEIARQIQRDLAILSTSLRNVPARHRSMVAVFDHSWALLPPAERERLRRLAVFRGGFTAAAARAVAGAGRRELAALAERSWLRRGSTGRYEMHPLVRRYAGEKLIADPDAHSAARAAHAAHFAAFLAAEEAALQGPDQQRALARVAAELDNLRRAWRHACGEEGAAPDPALLAQMILPLFLFYSKRSLHQEGFVRFGRAVAALEAAGEGSPALMARLLVRRGRLGEHVSRDFEAARQLFNRGLALAREQGLAAEQAQALKGLGTLALMRGAPDQAEDFLNQCLEICRRGSMPETLANTLVMFAWLRHMQGASAAGKQMSGEAIAIHRESGDPVGVAAALTARGTIHSDLGEFGPAEASFAEALAICRRTNHRVGESQALTGLFNVAYRQGDFEKAAAYARQSVDAGRDSGNRLGTAIACHNLGAVEARAGHHRRAVEAYREAQAIYEAIRADGARRSNNHVQLAASLLALEEMDDARREIAEALRLLPEASRARLGPELLLTAARLLRRLGDEPLAAAVIHFLEEAEMMPATSDPPPPEVGASAPEIPLASLDEALDAVLGRLEKRPGG